MSDLSPHYTLLLFVNSIVELRGKVLAEGARLVVTGPKVHWSELLNVCSISRENGESRPKYNLNRPIWLKKHTRLTQFSHIVIVTVVYTDNLYDIDIN